DISTVTTISKAKLRVFARSNSSGTFGVSAYAVASTGWSETGITWNNKPARSSSALRSITVGGTSLGAYDLDVTSYVQSQKSAGQTVVSFDLHAPGTIGQIATFNSREASNSRPQLVITP